MACIIIPDQNHHLANRNYGSLDQSCHRGSKWRNRTVYCQRAPQCPRCEICTWHAFPSSIFFSAADVACIQQEIKALTRPESLSKPVNADLKNRGVDIIPVDLSGPLDKIIEALTGIDVVISAIFFGSLGDEIPLANAAKAAGVKRFVQSAFMVVVPPRGVVNFREKVTRPSKTHSNYNALLTSLLERGKLQPHPENWSAVHIHRCWLVVSNHASPSSFGTPRLSPSSGPT